MIDKRIFFYWASNRITWMRYISIASFKALNPEWEVTLYTNDGTDRERNGYDESICVPFEKLTDIGVKIKRDDGFLINASNIRNSDIFRWKLLAKESTLYSDTDVIFVRPMLSANWVLDSDCIIFIAKDGYKIGFMGSGGDNKCFDDLYQLANQRTSNEDYQAAGVGVIHDLIRSRRVSLPCLYPNMKICVPPPELIYPIDIKDLNKFYTEILPLPGNCIGVHWYGGYDMSRADLMNQNTYKAIDNTFCHYARIIAQQIEGKL